MTESHFQLRLEQQGWSRFDAKKANAIALEAWKALQHIYGHGVLETPLQRHEALEKETGGGCHVHLKLELLQVPGSFKVRGATHALAEMRRAGARRVVTASTGNHAWAVVHAARQLSPPGEAGVRPTVFLPETADPGKRARLEGAGVDLRLEGADCADTESAARAAAEREAVPYISPYNDTRVAGGQGTVAFELLMQLSKLDVVFVPVGGGGLIAGIASVLKAVHPGVCIIGCQPAASAVMAASVEAGRLLQDVPSGDTLSDATAGGVEAGSVTWEPCRDLVDDWVLVSEREIASAMVELAARHGLGVEGASGVALAGFRKHAPRMRGKSIAVVVSGGNASEAAAAKAQALVHEGRFVERQEQR